jgi:phospholipid/cholesterol/gamma-HCH transport system permease protein
VSAEAPELLAGGAAGDGLIRAFLRRLGAGTLVFGGFLGGTVVLAASTAREAVRRPFNGREIVRQMKVVGVKSLTIVTITSLFVGMVLALQFAYGLERFGAKLYVAKLVGLALVREMAPVLTSLLVGGKVGSGMTAEIGSMSVTEQVDAVRALGANPVKKLVVPRVLAMTLMMPVLAIYADVIGILGGLIVCVTDVGMRAGFYFSSLADSVMIHDVFHGVMKTVFFGFFIGIIGCYQGLRTSGGTEGVGASTTLTVVVLSITILVGDFFLTKLFWLF